MKKLLLTILFSLVVLTAYPQEVISEFSEETLPVLNEELRKQDKAIENNTADILWEEDGGDTELKTADDLDMQNKEIKGLLIENRTDDTGCTQTGRIWFRTDI